MTYAGFVYRANPSRLLSLMDGSMTLLTSTAAPTISAITPASGAVGSTIGVTGTNFTGTTSVLLGSTPLTYSIISDTNISATVPVGAATGAVTVTNPSGSATSSTAFTVTSIPADTSVAWTQVLNEQFVDNTANRWSVYNNNTFGAPNGQIQTWMAANSIFGATPTPGATGGTSLRQVVKRENVGSTNFTAGMLDSKSTSTWYPLYCYWEVRVRVPHGHGIWPATWLTSKAGGANTAEWDMVEYFHSEIPGKMSLSFHGQNGSGVHIQNWYTNSANYTFFEAPTYNPGWHVWASEILPVTDATGTVVNRSALTTGPSQYVRVRVWLDGSQVFQFVNTDSLYWTTNGGTVGSFWNIYVQGSQIDGAYTGHPDLELAYSEERNACLIGGTPGSCIKTKNGYNVQRAGAGLQTATTATMGGDAVTYEHDYMKFYQAS